ncbi:hypothetical protein JOM56_013622 [Amanita muscaria]
MNHVSRELVSHSDSGYSASTSRDKDSYAGSLTTVTGDTLGLNVADMHVGSHSEGGRPVEGHRDGKGVSIPGRREDFDSDAGWQHWRTLETAELQQLMVAMVQANPALAKSTPSGSMPSPPPVGAPRPGSVYSAHLYQQPALDVQRARDGAADDEDYQAGSHPFTYPPPNPRKYCKRLVDLCLQRDLDRMLSPESRLFLGALYERDSIPVQCVPEALGGVMRAVGECEAEHLMIQDPSDLEAVIHILDHATDSGLLDKSTLGFEARFDDIQAIVKGNQGVNRALPLLMMTDEIEKGEKLLRKRFGEPVLGQLDLNALFMQVVVPRFISDVRNSQKRLYESPMNGSTPDMPSIMLFARAIAADLFEAEGHEEHSSSIVNLFDSLRSPISVLQELEWADVYQEARFFTASPVYQDHLKGSRHALPLGGKSQDVVVYPTVSVPQCCQDPVEILGSRVGSQRSPWHSHSLYQSTIRGSSSSEVQIPLPQSKKSQVRPDGLTDVEVEQAIVPLFDYFDANLPKLNTYLSDSAKVMVKKKKSRSSKHPDIADSSKSLTQRKRPKSTVLATFYNKIKERHTSLENALSNGEELSQSLLTSLSSGSGNSASGGGYMGQIVDARARAAQATTEEEQGKEMIVDLTVQGETIRISSAVSAIDTGTTLIGGPSKDVAAIYKAIPGSQAVPQSGGLYAFPCNTAVSVTMSFSGGRSWAISTADMIVAQVPQTSYCVGGIFDLNLDLNIPPTADNPAWVIGDTFLKNVYSVFRYSPPSVGFAQLSAQAGAGSSSGSGGLTPPTSSLRGPPGVVPKITAAPTGTSNNSPASALNGKAVIVTLLTSLISICFI